MRPPSVRLAAGLTLALAVQAPYHAGAEPEAARPALFAEIARQAGLDFVHHNGMSGELYFAEMMGGGGALFDYDNDGDLDVFLVQGGPLGASDTAAQARFSDRLYRNDLEVAADGRRSLTFVDVTAESRIAGPGYGMGVAAGDYDNDGWTDLYVTHFGDNRLWRNNGAGAGGTVTFTDVTADTGTGDGRWSVSASFLDFDRDGRLDLYVVNYVNFALATHKVCRSYTGAPDYCSPLAYKPEPDALFQNTGAGTFKRVTVASGVYRETGAGLGVVSADFDADGWPDVYVANDQSANQMWMHQGAGAATSFRDDALLAGTALNAEGRPEAGMGVDAGDLDGDGDFDLLVSHLDRETNTFYANDGDGFFEDRTATSGLGEASWRSTGFGLALLDYDNDGRLDVAVANGAVKHLEPLVRRGDPYPLHQPNQLFRNLGRGRFAEVTAEAGEGFALSEVSRGLAVGDVDNDGDTDLLVVNNNGPVRLLLNQVGQDRPWLGLRLLSGRRDALGASVTVARRGGPPLRRRVGTDGSYACGRDPRVLVGLGDAPGVTRLEVRWPSGRAEAFEIEGVGRYVTLREGSSTASPGRP